MVDLRIEEKLQTLVKILGNWRLIRREFPLEVSYYKDKDTSLAHIKKIKTWKKFTEPFLLFTDNTYTWFRSEFSIDKKQNKYLKAYLGVDTYLNRSTDCNLRPQANLYLNDKLVSGVDVNHCDTLINQDGHYTMYLHLYTHELIQVQQYTNQFNQTFPLHFSIKYCDSRIEEAYYDYLTIYDALSLLVKDDKRYIEASKVINEAMNLIDLRNRDENFYRSLIKSREYLYKNYFLKLCGKEKHTINCVGHAHIDMAWLWDIEQTRHKGQRTFASALKLMEEYPEYKYTHTSPQLFKFIEHDNPTLFKRIKQKVKEGRFEIDGTTWIEPDCNLTSGESLVRQILYGKDYLLKTFNIDSKTLMLPDVFGYSYQIPQILKKSGVTRFVTAKIGWNDTNRIPYDSFKWVGLDGTSIFTYLISTCDAYPRLNIFDTTFTSYNARMMATNLMGAWNRYQDKDYNNAILLTYGYGDGGGGPTREMIEKSRRFAYGLPGLGKTKLSTLNEALDEAENNFNKNAKRLKKIPTWNDELYLEYHRGTYTSVPRIKKNNRECEFLLQNAELVSSISTLTKKESYPHDEIVKNFETLLLHQFHDILPGSAIKKVYLDADRYLGNVKRNANKIINNSLSTLSNHLRSPYLAFNPNSFSCTMPIMVNNKCYVIKDIPSIGYKSFELVSAPNKIKISDKRLVNDYFDVRFNNNGEIISLIDKVNKKELVAKGKPINQFVVYEDMPYKYDNWEISRYYSEKFYPLSKTATFTKIDEGDRKGFKITHRYFKSIITQYVYLYNNGINRIDFVNHIVWKEKLQLLKVHFPLNIKCDKVRCDIQFGSIARNCIPRNSYDEAKFEICAQKWVDMSDGKYGVALLNDGKYGHSVKGNNLALTILKSGSYPFPEASDIVPDFTYSIYPHKGNYQNAQLINEAYALNRPAILISNAHQRTYKKEESSFIEVNAKGVYIETLKRAHNDDSFILRGYESSNKERDILIKINLPFKNAYLTNLIEKDIAKLKVINKVIKLHVKPFEIFTVRIK